MRMKFVASVVVVIAAVIVATPMTLGQRGGGGSGKSGFGKGGFSFGGMQSGITMVQQDPQGLFDKLAKGRDYFLVSETFTLRETLTQFAKDQGIQDEKIGRTKFMVYADQMKAKMGGAGSASAAPSAGTTFKKPEGGGSGQPSDADVAAFRIEFEFRRFDSNSDGTLNSDEMPDSLRDDLARWDRNEDRAIDMAEYRVYAQARNQARSESSNNRGPDTEVIELNPDDLDRRPVVYRAGKLPKELEAMFKELDNDSDGNIDLAEWRAGSRTIADFKGIDRNEDGLLTSEEILRHQSRPVTAQNGESGRGDAGRGFGGRSFGGGGSGGNPFWMRKKN